MELNIWCVSDMGSTVNLMRIPGILRCQTDIFFIHWRSSASLLRFVSETPVPPPCNSFLSNTIYSCENIQTSRTNPFHLVGCFGRMDDIATHYQVAQSAITRQATGYSRSIFNFHLHYS
jgi:hypothetical protein